MIHAPNYANSLRCIAQHLQTYGVDIFQLSTDRDVFLVEYLDPQPPYLKILNSELSAAQIEILSRHGESKRRYSKSEFRFDSFPEILRAAGRYVDTKRAELRRIKNCSAESGQVELEYQTRAGELRSEILDTSVLRDRRLDVQKTQPDF